MPISLPSWSRLTLRVVTLIPLRRALSNGPASVTMLSPATETTRIGTGLRFGKFNDQSEESPEATSS